MAKRRGRPANGATDGSLEATVVKFAEDLGRILGTAQRKAEDWMNQRQAITEQLTQIRDTASKYLHQLSGAGADIAGAVRRGRGRPRMDPMGGGVPSPFGAVPETAGGGQKRKRKGMSAAARKAVGARMKKYWAERRKAEGR